MGAMDFVGSTTGSTEVHLVNLTPAGLGLAADHPWLLEFDFVSLFEGSVEEIEALIAHAPTAIAASYLRGWLDCRLSHRGLYRV